jgi:hypothetical protein
MFGIGVATDIAINLRHVVHGCISALGRMRAQFAATPMRAGRRAAASGRSGGKPARRRDGHRILGSA